MRLSAGALGQFSASVRELSNEAQPTGREIDVMEPGEGTSRRQARDIQIERATTTAILRFQHSAASSSMSRSGHLRPGGRLVVEYDPARLPPPGDTSTVTWEIVCHVRFDPGA